MGATFPNEVDDLLGSDDRTTYASIARSPAAKRALSPSIQRPLELWGGVECTINRVGDVYFDQFGKAGHRDRVEADAARFAELGITTLRTAMHWEHYEETRSWANFDRLVDALEMHGIEPIIGLVHHGSGPLGTDLLDPAFPMRLADFALKVANRYPSLRLFTPVNEPQTTGRFACLYGHWYPHHRSMKSYLRALVNQIKGTVLSMEAIRTVNPRAGLIHTEDGGQFFSAPELESYRLARERRRWLGTDLLCGMVGADHPLFPSLLQNGLEEHEILWFREHPCPPATLGLNYYVTSDRFLDHRRELYPAFMAGGDTGDEPLIDIEAVRVCRKGIGGVMPILKQAWERYGIPVAITEAHLGCNVEEQRRWLAEVWHDACAARAEGVEVRAVTAWALLGSFNWSHLCTQDTDSYEAGIFELKHNRPTATRLTDLVETLCAGKSIEHGTFIRRGWWHDPDRFTVLPA